MKSRFLACAALTVLSIASVACEKKVAKAPPPPPPPARESAPATVASTPSRPAPAAPYRAPAAQTTPRMPDAATRARIQELLDRIQDAYFDYDKHTIRPDAQAALNSDAQTLGEIVKQYPDFHLTVEGYCDERGSEEYNLALGDARAKQAKEYLAGMGVPADQLKILSLGKDRPICLDHDEACWQKNRRAHITQAQ
jgi:peptidoglycan-associated lipoprotein